MAYDFSNKVCIITGAASGIGRASAQKMHSLGARLALSDINEAGLAETNKLCGKSNYTQLSSVAVLSDCETFVYAVAKHFGHMDFLFNCAGVNPTAFPLTETTDEYYDKLMHTNLRGTYAMSRAVVPHLRPGGSIVNVSSILGVSVESEYAIYCATKWAVVGFTKALALELGPKSLRVNAVAPGYIDTPTNSGVVAGPEAVKQAEAKIAMGRMGTASEVADVVAFLFSDEARYMNGSIVEVNGGR